MTSKQESKKASTMSASTSSAGSASSSGATAGSESPVLRGLALERRARRAQTQRDVPGTGARRHERRGVKVRVRKKAATTAAESNAEANDDVGNEAARWHTMTDGLTGDELAAVETFAEWMASSDAPRSAHVPHDRFEALKFMRGCKFREEKARDKYAKWVAVRDELGDCSLERVAPFLATDAHCMPPGAVDNGGCGMMYVAPRRLDRDHDFKTRNRVRSTAYLFDRVLSERRFQEAGLSLLIDFKDAPFTLNRQAQSDTHKLIEALPCRLGAGYIVDTPWFFSILLKVVSSFTAKKLLARVQTVSRKDLPSLIPIEHLLVELGGKREFDMYSFLLEEYRREGIEAPLWLVHGDPPPAPMSEFE